MDLRRQNYLVRKLTRCSLAAKSCTLWPIFERIDLVETDFAAGRKVVINASHGNNTNRKNWVAPHTNVADSTVWRLRDGNAQKVTLGRMEKERKRCVTPTEPHIPHPTPLFQGQLRGLPNMTSKLDGGRGVPQKSRQKEQNQLVCDSDRGGEGVKRSENFVDVIYGSPKAPALLWKS